MSDRHLKNAISYFKPITLHDARTSRWKLLKCEARRRKWDINDAEGIVPPDEPIESRFDILDF